jgi:hypothetical protein
VLAIVDEVLKTILIVWEPACGVHATKLGVVHYRLSFWVGHSLRIGAIAPIEDAFSVSFDGSWKKGQRSQNMGSLRKCDRQDRGRGGCEERKKLTLSGLFARIRIAHIHSLGVFPALSSRTLHAQ